PFIRNKLLVCQRARQQAHRLLELDAALGQTALVQRVAIDQMLAQHAGGPDAELRGPRRTDAITHGNDGVEVVVLDVSLNRTLALLANHPEFPDSWLALKLTLGKNIAQMLIDCANVF